MKTGWTAALALSLGFGSQLAHAEPLSAEALYEKVSPSIWLVQLRPEQGPVLGSAVVVSPETLITNCHILAKAASIQVRQGARRFDANLAYRDPSRDLCEIRAPGLTAPAVTIGDWQRTRIGAKLFAVGNATGLEFNLWDGILSGIRRPRGEVEALQTSVPTSAGSSGGGLFDTNGHLVGVTTDSFRDSPNITFALPATWIGELRQRAGAAESLPIRTAIAAGSTPEARSPALSADRVSDAQAPRSGSTAPREAVSGTERFEYVLRDRLTGLSRPVVYRIDRREGGQISMNDGSRIEDGEGHVVKLTTTVAGEFEQAMPPGGWLPRKSGSGPGRYQSIGTGNGGAFTMELKAGSETEEVLNLAGRALRTVRVQFNGFTQRGFSNIRGSYRATVWYAPELQRVVRFEARTRGGVGGTAFVLHEVMELAYASPTSSQ